MKKIRLAIVGVCITRHVFNKRFVKDHSIYYDVVKTLFQSSIISVVSKPAKIDKKILDCAPNATERLWLQEDIYKGALKELIEAKPEYVLFDLYAEVRWSVLRYKKSYITNNTGPIRKSFTVQNEEFDEEYSIRKNKEEYIELFKKHFDIFYRTIQFRVPKAKFVIHTFRYGSSYIDENNEITPLDINKYSFINTENELLKELNDYVISKYDVRVLDMTEKEYFSHFNHYTGKSPWHMETRYHNDFFNKLNNICFKDLLEERK